MKSVLLYDFSGQGEGQSFKIVYTNSAVTDEEALAEAKSLIDAYYHRDIELINLDVIQFDSKWMRIIEAHVPILFKYITGERDYRLSIDYNYHVNYS